jgi:hypothetical protein
MTHRWESLAGYCTRCHLDHETVWRDPRLTECQPEVVVGIVARRPSGIIVEKFDGSRVTITEDPA